MKSFFFPPSPTLPHPVKNKRELRLESQKRTTPEKRGEIKKKNRRKKPHGERENNPQ